MKCFTRCLLLASAASALTVTSPPPAQPDVTLVGAPTLGQSQSSMTWNSNLPSQQELLQYSSSPSSSLLISAGTETSAPPAKQNLAVSGVAITGINYNGNVPTTEADEYVIVTNANKQPVDVSDYYIYVATSGTQGSTFYFPRGSVVKPNQSIRIYTNEIHPETGGYSYKSGKALWNNRGGLAVMKDVNGKKICEFKYAPPKA